jgi:hypothetical protein
MPTRFARRKKPSKQAEAKEAKTAADVPIATAPPASGNLEELLKELLTKAYNFVISNNSRVRGRILWVKSGNSRVYAAVDDRYLSNALYHALRALGRNRVRRWFERGKWMVAYS